MGHARLAATHPLPDAGFTFYVFSSDHQAAELLAAGLLPLPAGDYQIWLAASPEGEVALMTALAEVNGFRATLVSARSTWSTCAKRNACAE